jgi:hypothetical protein
MVAKRQCLPLDSDQVNQIRTGLKNESQDLPAAVSAPRMQWITVNNVWQAYQAADAGLEHQPGVTNRAQPEDLELLTGPSPCRSIANQTANSLWRTPTPWSHPKDWQYLADAAMPAASYLVASQTLR